jgi:dihydropteroate synthase
VKFPEVPSLINCGGRLISLQPPVVMGILNLTPDSFYDGGKFTDSLRMLRHVRSMIVQGACIIDVGAQSSRPGARLISEKEELKRLMPALELLIKKFPEMIFSVDTFRSAVARAALESGVHIVNDISGGSLDKRMYETVARYQAPYILMHMKGTPATMQKNPAYRNVVTSVIHFLQSRIYRLRQAGVKDIIVDPGFGFGKTLQHNLTLLNHLSEIRTITGCPVLAGMSRKSMINQILQTTPAEALNGTTVMNTLALWQNVDILRVHDVREAVQAIKIVQAVKNNRNRLE